MKKFNITDLLITIAITIFGLANGEVTVFYIIYLFWFQELIRTIADWVYIKRIQKEKNNVTAKAADYTGSLFLLFVYLVFIVVLFCFMLNWGNYHLLGENLKVLFFRNLFFDCNLILFAVSFIYFRMKGENQNIRISVFNPRHLILHISIILGAVIQFFIVKRYNIESWWGSVAVIAPFLLLKLFFEIKFQEEAITKEQL